MTFNTTTHAAQAILDNQHNRLHNQIATKRTPLIARITRKATVTPLPQTQPTTSRAAA